MNKRPPLIILRDVIFALVLREVRGRLGANRLGAFWLIFEPLAHIVILISIYTLIRAHKGYLVQLPVFLAAGVIPFLLFKNVALKGMEAVSANKALFSYRQIKPFDAIFSRVIVESSLMLCIYALVMLVLSAWGGYAFAIHKPLAWFAYLGAGIAMSFGLALLFCIVGEAVPEVKTIFRLAFTPLYFISGVIVPVWMIPKKYLEWILWNPFLHVIEGMHQSLFSVYPKITDVNLYYPWCWAISLIFVGLALYRARRLNLVAI
ncbi:ABC transporter permease [Bordetella hinzii]|uniref:ABC transporter permease n=1 Tax=Bordetella hinzii TaxID=103855 RepID=UPI000519D306|nr:ABC transporter permease [Bordetella hinzii]KXA74050.1 sugar ABC transporter permease [Bordetella hinzii LMG 13501]MCJ9707704.1 ABC transporter permease [Bordetella hinzii]QDJ55485.1 sugar ABC transporter permease [Bordetella hinzii]VEH25611.1 permease of an ABC exporter involved in polysaccharide export [Bordetella hinzii]